MWKKSEFPDMQITTDYIKQRVPKETTELLASRTQYVIMKAQLAGNMVFDGHAQTAEERNNADECRKLCCKVECQLQSCNANEIPILLSCYDSLYMVGYRRMPDGNLTNRYKRRVIEAWKRGDKTIEESDVFGLIAFDCAYPSANSDSEYVSLYRSIKEKWLDTLTKFDRFVGVTTKESYERLVLITRENLDNRFGADSSKMKRRWYKANKVSDLSILTTTILSTYRRFISTLSPEVLTHDEQISIDILILKELSSRPDLYPYARDAYRLALDYISI